MSWFAALIMLFVYIYNIPVTAAVVATEKGCAAAFRPFAPFSALKAARQRAVGEKKHIKKRKTENSLSRMMLPLRTFSTLREILPYITLEYFRINARVGLDDAALTAVLCGFLTSVGHMAACRARLPGKVRVISDFNSSCLEGEICAVFQVRVRDALHAASRIALREDESTPIIRFLRLYGRIIRDKSAAHGQ